MITDLLFFFLHSSERWNSLSGLMLVLLLVYGTANMEVVTPHYMTYTSPRLQEPCKVVFFADLHFGSSQSAKVVDRTFDRIRSEARLSPPGRGHRGRAH